MVQFEGALSPQSYVRSVTGLCYIFWEIDISAMISEIHSHLKSNGYDGLWDFPLSEIDIIVENEHNVVLVELTGEDDDGEWKTIFRWFEVPEGFTPRVSDND